MTPSLRSIKGGRSCRTLVSFFACSAKFPKWCSKSPNPEPKKFLCWELVILLRVNVYAYSLAFFFKDVVLKINKQKKQRVVAAWFSRICAWLNSAAPLRYRSKVFFFFFFSIFFTVKVDVFGAFACRNRGCAVRSLTYFATLRPQVVLLFRFWASPFKRNKTIRMLFETAFTVKVTLWCLWYILIECPCFNVGVFFFLTLQVVNETIF